MAVSSFGTARELVGRDAELQRIASFLDAAAGSPSALVIEGEAGIGKTSLWTHAVSVARHRGHRVLSCRAAESEATLSFTGCADLFEGCDDLLSALPDPQRHALDVALLRAEPSGPAPDRRAVSVSVLSALREAATRCPVLVAVDDAQWLDGSTARVLEFAIRRLAKEPIGLLLAQRGEDGSAIPLGIARALPVGRATRLTLGPLSVDDVQELVRDRLGASFPPETLRRLHETSGGNPFFALEIARAELAGERRATGSALPIPRSLREDLVRDHLGTLSSAAREALLYASACSRPTVALLEAAADGRLLGNALSKAADVGVVELDRGKIRFAHPLFGSAIYADASREHRHRVHRRLAEVVSDPEERARHLALAAEGPDASAAAALEEAARSAHARGSPASAAELCELAERLVPADRDADVRRLRTLAADYHLLAADYGRAVSHLEAVAATTPPGPQRAEAFLHLGRVLFFVDARGSADALAEAAGEKDTRPDLASAIHLWRSWAEAFVGDVAEAERHARTALEMAERGQAAGAIADASTTLITMQAWLGREAAVAERPTFLLVRPGLDVNDLDEAGRICCSLLEAAALLALGTIRRRAKQKRPAREAFDGALAIFEGLGVTSWAERARTELARISGRRPENDLTEAEARVARLAAAGRTNREIAEALFMSVRTVEGHLSHAYRKLEVRSRTELSLFLSEDERAIPE